MPKIQELKNNLKDIQGNVLRGYTPVFAQYRFYNIRKPDVGRAWLGKILEKKTGDLEHLRITHSGSWAQADKKRPPFTVNIAFSHQGLKALGLPTEVLEKFPDEFKEGMRNRAVVILGDEAKGTSEEEKEIPKNWEDLFLQDDDAKTIHALIIITGKSEESKNEGVKCLEKIEKNFPGVHVLNTLEGKRRPSPNDSKEHFGYTDGISQPFIEGSAEVYGGNTAYDGQGTPDKEGRWRDLKPGEFILGYEDEFGEVAQSPPHYDLRKNGSYLVFRKLEQDVKAFDEFCTETAKALWPSTYTSNPEHYRKLIMAKFMGRWPSGCPLTLSPNHDDEAIASNETINNRFLYTKEFVHKKNGGPEEQINDKDGMRCPLGSHIRRTNPRDHQLLASKDIYDEENNYEYHMNRHRIIRRGLTYGEEYTGTPEDTGPRGIIFMALNASIARQFEFIQQSWVDKDEHLGVDKTNRDPIIGQKHDGRAKFTVPGAENPFVFNLSRFVVERGGEYFFYPGLGALQKLADGAFPALPSFLSDYEAVKSMSHNFRGAGALQVLVRNWLTDYAPEMFEELHKSHEKAHKVFQVDPVPPPKKVPDLAKPEIVIATKYVDVVKILKNEKQTFNPMPPFSVFLYKKKMPPPRGPFVLGLEYFEKKYVEELRIIKEAVYPSGMDIGKTIYETVDRLAREIMKEQKPKGKLDVIGELVWPVTLRLLGEFFGVPGPGPEARGSEPNAREETLKRWCRDIYTDIFLNLRNNMEWTRLADKAVTELNDYLDDLIKSKQKELRNCSHVAETVLTRLIKIQEGAGNKFEDGWDGVRRNLLGIVVGVVETTLKAVPRTIDQLLRKDREDVLAKTREAALEYTHDQDPKRFKDYVFEAMRFNPQNHVLYRLAIGDFTLGDGKYWETHIKASVEKPVLVFAANLSAMFDPDEVVEPDKFNIDRPPHHYLFFGYGPHECLGKYMSEIQIPLLIKHVLTLEGLRRAVADTFNPRDILPKHYFLEFKAETSSGPD